MKIFDRLVAALVLACAVFVGACLWASFADAQSPAAVLGAVCSDAARPYELALLGVFLASAIAWSKRIMAALPAPVQHLINFAAFNWRAILAAFKIVSPVVMVLMVAGALTACSGAQQAAVTAKVGSTVAKANAALSASHQQIQMACWGIQAADAVFRTTYAASPKADPAVVADEAKAVAAANVTCANPPANLAQALADLMATYKSITGKSAVVVAPATASAKTAA